MTDTRTTLQGVKPHEKYHLNGGDLHIIAEDREFCVHRYFFERDSAKFRGLLASPSPGQPRKGSSHLTAIKLDGVSVKEFEIFLWVFYNPTYSLYDTTFSEWSCILHLGHEWQFAEVEKLAVRELEKMPMPVVDRIVLYQKHNVSEDLLLPHFAIVCARGSPLDLDESERLGMSTVVLINQTMHFSYTKSSPTAKTANTALIVKILAHIGEVKVNGTPTSVLPNAPNGVARGRGNSDSESENNKTAEKSRKGSGNGMGGKS
ncbi:hypothetical protein R3P38DRAFT_2846650 [Favolaschia claudopus]|uniref:BTB domain-containing protein n=1 Tax=Favolaschia claudopus TaxID=2862362 RepID=A0AAW0DUM1_9AGAR